MRLWFLFPLIFCGVLAAADVEMPAARDITCTGKIESFQKDGFQALGIDGVCERFDTTWVSITSPKEFTGVRHMLLSRTSSGKSAFGKNGATVTFSAFQSTLEVEKHPETVRIDAKRLLAEIAKSGETEKKQIPVPDPTAPGVMSGGTQAPPH